MRVVLAVLLFLGALALFRAAREGQSQTGGLTVTRFGQKYETPVRTVSYSAVGRVTFYLLGGGCFVGALYCVAGVQKK
jgi:hypothetical protein